MESMPSASQSCRRHIGAARCCKATLSACMAYERKVSPPARSLCRGRREWTRLRRLLIMGQGLKLGWRASPSEASRNRRRRFGGLGLGMCIDRRGMRCEGFMVLIEHYPGQHSGQTMWTVSLARDACACNVALARGKLVGRALVERSSTVSHDRSYMFYKCTYKQLY